MSGYTIELDPAMPGGWTCLGICRVSNDQRHAVLAWQSTSAESEDAECVGKQDVLVGIYDRPFMEKWINGKMAPCGIQWKVKSEFLWKVLSRVGSLTEEPQFEAEMQYGSIRHIDSNEIIASPRLAIVPSDDTSLLTLTGYCIAVCPVRDAMYTHIPSLYFDGPDRGCMMAHRLHTCRPDGQPYVN